MSSMKSKVDQDGLLALMRAYFADKAPPETLEQLSELPPRSLLKESLDVVDFVCYLEEELARDIDLARLGTALQQDTFGALAAQAAGWLSEE